MNNTENMAFDDDEIKAASELLFYGNISTSYERIFRDAIIFYQLILMRGVPKEMHDKICARAALANIWLIEHGYKVEPFDDELVAGDTAVNNSQPTDKKKENCQ
jgi:hypothetical protein